MAKKPLRIAIVAGETSGDILAAGFISAFRKQYPDTVFEGIAGPRMLAAGCQTLCDMEELSVMGLAEVLPKIRRLLHIRKSLIQHFLDNPPDLYIGVDAPDFNLPVEKRLKQAGIRTIHYVCPTIWAWRESRAKKIAAATDSVFCIFPFEPEHCQKHGIDGHFVGHSLADQIDLDVDKAAARERLHVDVNDKVLAVLPGSRAGEVAMLLHDFVQSAELLAEKIPGLQVLIPVVNKQRKEQIDGMLAQWQISVGIRTVYGHAQDVMIASDAVLLASGTAALEAMLCKRPMVVAYKLKRLTYFMMQRLYKPKYFALPNILSGEQMVPELIQEQVNPQNVAKHLLQQWQRPSKPYLAKCVELHQTLKQDADQTSARTAIELLQKDGKLAC